MMLLKLAAVHTSIIIHAANTGTQGDVKDGLLVYIDDITMRF